MSEINKIGPLAPHPVEHKALKKEAPEGLFAEELLKSAQAVDQEIDQMIQGAQESNMDSQVNEIGKSIQSLAGIVENLAPEKGEKQATLPKLAASRYEKMDPKAPG